MAETNAPICECSQSEGGELADLVGEYVATLGGRSTPTVDAYGRILRSLAEWVAERPGESAGFRSIRDETVPAKPACLQTRLLPGLLSNGPTVGVLTSLVAATLRLRSSPPRRLV